MPVLPCLSRALCRGFLAVRLTRHHKASDSTINRRQRERAENGPRQAFAGHAAARHRSGRAHSRGLRRDDLEARAKADESPVTEADEAADALISAGLRAAFPDVPS
jgi:fructose-1,6-bisphosphatase/inositol monophosphatase family enzyme